MNTNHKIFNEIAEQLHDAIHDAICDDNDSVYVDYYVDDDASLIEIEAFCDGKIVVDFYVRELDKNEKEYPNIRVGIEEAAPDWREVEDEVEEENQPYDEWNEHGFRDA